MTTTQYSSGPWRVWQNRISPTESELEIFDSENYKVANIARWKDEGKHESEANARLIANAPDLLSALRNLADYVFRLESKENICSSVWMEAREAIAKAEGRTE